MPSFVVVAFVAFVPSRSDFVVLAVVTLAPSRSAVLPPAEGRVENRFVAVVPSFVVVAFVALRAIA